MSDRRPTHDGSLEVDHERNTHMSELNGLSLPDTVTVYGIDACDDTTRALRHLEAAGLPHSYVKLDEDAGAKARLTAAGYLATPVVVTPAGQLFVEPSDAELDEIVASVAAGTIRPATQATSTANAR
jgi:glutaredoxin